MSKTIHTRFLVPFIEKSILRDRNRFLVTLILSVSPALKKEIIDRLSKDRVNR